MKGVKIVTDTLNCAILSTRTARNHSFTTLVWCATSWDSSTVEWYMWWWCHECVQCVFVGVTLQRRHNIVGQHTKTISTLHQLVWRWLLVAFMAVRPQLGLCSACLKPVFLANATSATCVLMMMKWRWGEHNMQSLSREKLQPNCKLNMSPLRGNPPCCPLDHEGRHLTWWHDHGSGTNFFVG